MFEVRGLPILASEMEVLQRLKEYVQETQGRTILHKMKVSGDNILVCCPIHNNGQERRPSCGISTVRMGDKKPGVVHCFACGYIDSLEGMISKVLGDETTDITGTNWLLDNFITGEEGYKRPAIPINMSRETVIQQFNYVTEQELASYRFYHPYMYQRKLTNEVIERYDVGYQKDYKFNDTWLPTEVVTFPVRDKDGNCLFVSRRAIHNKTFFLPTNIEKPVYGIYEIPQGCNEVLICESVINALTSVVYGRTAVALFGTGNAAQYETLRKLPVRKFVLALDPDNAGQKGTYKLIKALKGTKLLTKLIVPEGKDINDLTKEEFLNLEEKLV